MKSLGLLFAVVTAILWGLIYAVDEKILTRTSPLLLLFINSAVTTLILLPFVISRSSEVGELLRSGKNNLLLIALTVVLVTLSNFLIYSSIQKIGATTASMIEIAYPLFVALFGALLFTRNISLPVLLGGLLIFLGSFCIIRWG